MGFLTVAFFTLQYINRANAAIVVEIFTDKDAFINRLGGTNAVRVINFDDIDTSPTDPVGFPADRYQVSHGIRITGESGQIASKNFGLPQDFVPVSIPNMYAPGPIDNSSTSGRAGGKTTEVLFFSGNIVALTAGFGLFFIDADYPNIGPSSLTVYNLSGTQIKTSGTVITTNGQAAFRGFITIDTNTNQPVPLIARALIINGRGWPGNDSNEGATLDDFVFAIPTTAPTLLHLYLPLIINTWTPIPAICTLDIDDKTGAQLCYEIFGTGIGRKCVGDGSYFYGSFLAGTYSCHATTVCGTVDETLYFPGGEKSHVFSCTGFPAVTGKEITRRQPLCTCSNINSFSIFN